jgi:hypothetical protein
MAEAGDRLPARRRPALLAAMIVVALVAIAAAAFAAARDSTSDGATTSGDMAERAADVMPFDLDATTHTFTKTNNGGVQTVVANDDADSRNIELIRSHLADEARSFRRGDFSDPARIHGMDMPGVEELEAGAARVDVHYEGIAAGGRITYSTSEPELVAALHAWFDRQNTDHAMPGMGG